MMGPFALRARLDDLQQHLQSLGALVAGALTHAVVSLLDDATASAGERVRMRDIRAGSAALSQECLEVIATQQPVASDLRLVMAIMSVATDLERIGSHGRSIARLRRRIRRDTAGGPLEEVPGALGELAQQTEDGLRAALAAFLARDEERARHLLRGTQVDDTSAALVQMIFQAMVSWPEALTAGLAQLDMVHKLERIDDRVTNIAERTVWVSTGTPPE